jgi:hypothetical protein
LVPIDWIIEALNRGPETGVYTHYTPGRAQLLDDDEYMSPLNPAVRSAFQHILKSLKPAERKNIMLNGGIGHMLEDITRVVNRFPLPTGPDTFWSYEVFINDKHRSNFHSVSDLHDRLMVALRRAENANRAIADAKRYDPANMWVNRDREAGKTAFMMEYIFQFEEVSLVIARDYGTLNNWSETMNNCISSYFTQSHVILGGVYDNTNKLIANFEVKQTKLADEDIWVFSLRQLLGVYNTRLEAPIRDMLTSYFKSMGIVIDNRIWW